MTCRWFSAGTAVPSTNKTDSHYLTEKLLKVALNTIDQTKPIYIITRTASSCTLSNLSELNCLQLSQTSEAYSNIGVINIKYICSR
jgi:hypothetical protein